MAYDELLAEYEARRAKALAGGGADKYAKGPELSQPAGAYHRAVLELRRLTAAALGL